MSYFGMPCHHELHIDTFEPSNTNKVCQEGKYVLTFICCGTVVHVHTQVSDPRWHIIFNISIKNKIK